MQSVVRKFPIIFGLVFYFHNTLLAQVHSSGNNNFFPNIDSLITATHKPDDDSMKVKAFHMLAASLAGRDPVAAVAYGKKGASLANRLNYERGKSSCYLNISYAYGLMDNSKMAVIYLDSSIASYKLQGRETFLGVCYHQRATHFVKLGLLKKALLDCELAYELANKYSHTKGSKNLIAEVYKTNGEIYFLQKNYRQSKTSYEKSFVQKEIIYDTINMIILLNRIGEVNIKQNEIDKGIQSFIKAVNLAIRHKQENELPSLYTNLSNAWQLKGDIKKAEQFTNNAIEFAGKKNNKVQMAIAQTMLSKIQLAKDSAGIAIKTATESYQFADSVNTPDNKIKSAEILAEGFYKSGQYKKAYDYLNISKNLSDSFANVKYSNDITAIQASFNLKEKDKEILLLGKDKELQVQKLSRQKTLLFGAASIALLSLAAIWLLFNRNKLKQLMKELELRNQIAADLHDEVGSSLSSINMLSQMATKPGNETLQKSILEKMSTNAKETMEKMSDLVWTIKPEEAEGSNLKQRMERFAYEICGAKNIALTLQLDKLETKDLTMDQRKNMYLIFKEALNNAVKYSETEKIAVSAANGNNMLTMIVKDEGKGFDMSTIQKGNGLENIQTRAASVGGKLTIDAAPGTGTTVKLTMPLTL